MTPKTTSEIRALLNDAQLDFDSIENKALNEYLPQIFRICPFTEDICTTKIDGSFVRNSQKIETKKVVHKYY